MSDEIYHINREDSHFLIDNVLLKAKNHLEFYPSKSALNFGPKVFNLTQVVGISALYLQYPHSMPSEIPPSTPTSSKEFLALITKIFLKSLILILIVFLIALGSNTLSGVLGYIIRILLVILFLLFTKNQAAAVILPTCLL